MSCRRGETSLLVEARIYQLSQSCRLTECTAFLSHSWHDDGQQKWLALETWCADYGHTDGCSPQLWLDKVCIEQSNIQADLQCLPIFLAGCNTLLIVSSITYTARLWCCVELFVYDCMQVEEESRHAPTVITIGADDDERERVFSSWRGFDATACQCFDARGKARIISVIERHPGGIDGFNRHIRTLATDTFGRRSLVSSARSVAPRAQPQQLGAELANLVEVVPGSVPAEPHTSWGRMGDFGLRRPPLNSTNFNNSGRKKSRS